MQVFFHDGTCTEQVVVYYPLGHRRRRAEGIPLLLRKFRDALATCFPPPQAQAIYALCQETQQLEAMPVPEFIDRLACKGEQP